MKINIKNSLYGVHTIEIKYKGESLPDTTTSFKYVGDSVEFPLYNIEIYVDDVKRNLIICQE